DEITKDITQATGAPPRQTLDLALAREGIRPRTLRERRRLYLLSRAIVARHYRRALTLEVVARALASSPRQVQRAYAQFGEGTFHEDLIARRMGAAAELLAEQSIPIRDVARLVGYTHPPHFARVFARRYGLTPARFRDQARAARHPLPPACVSCSEANVPTVAEGEPARARRPAAVGSGGGDRG
ncbi:MAG TPA: helix-turn-helix transcriptional regulator, partial [Solirubrobacteraceae bacterium]|nr:helix-turn-helix transcriptional regulator [Solirubrobacteraceae bacterium]